MFFLRTSLLLLLPIAGMARVTLPVEVVGADGTEAAVTIEVPADRAAQVHALSLQVHGLANDDMVSVRLNSGAWLPLNNQSVSVAEPGRSYGGIGGGFSTLKLTLPLPTGSVTRGENTLHFRFNRSDGLASGFRVLAFNLLTNSDEPVLPAATFEMQDPNTWQAPRADPQAASLGKALWYTAPLVVNNRPAAPAIRAHCSDCHAHDGRDLKYFNFSNASIIARSQFHGLSATEGEQIAGYIRSLASPNPGRPWNPPYQPGPGLDGQPVSNWAAGAGLTGVLDKDEDSLPFLFGGKAGALSISPQTFRPDGNLNPREIPISLQLPDWNHWLPRVHPVDAWGADFTQSDLQRLYGTPEGGPAEGSLRAQLASAELAKLIAGGDVAALFDRWTKSQRKFLMRYTPRDASGWSADLGNKVYSTQLWQLVKAWELAQEFQLEGRGQDFFGSTAEARGWPNSIPLATAPAEETIPDGPAGMNGTGLANEYFNNAWYELQILLNSGNHRRHGRQPVDWLYVIDRFRVLNNESRRPEPARLLIAVVKALQSSDPMLGPDNPLRGWRPESTVDPRIMVSPGWAPVFRTLAPDVRRSVTEAMMSAWLEKNLRYRIAQYFAQGKSSKDSYTAPKEFAEISGGNTWTAAPQFRASGVSEELVRRLLQWGSTYSSMSSRLQY
jgi:hypothetical protein